MPRVDLMKSESMGMDLLPVYHFQPPIVRGLSRETDTQLLDLSDLSSVPQQWEEVKRDEGK